MSEREDIMKIDLDNLHPWTASAMKNLTVIVPKREEFLIAALSVKDEELAEAKEEIKAFRKSEKELSDAYLRIRAIVGSWNTQPGGQDKFELTEKIIKSLITEIAALHKRCEEAERRAIEEMEINACHAEPYDVSVKPVKD